MTNSGEQKKEEENLRHHCRLSPFLARAPVYLFLQELLDAVARRAPRHAPPSAAPVLPEGDLDVVRGTVRGCGRRGRVGRACRRVERDRHGAEPCKMDEQITMNHTFAKKRPWNVQE